MINIDWVYETETCEGIREDSDAEWNRFAYYICYGNRLLAKVFNINDDDLTWRVIIINKNWTNRKFKLYWYYSKDAIIWFILWVLYNGERESNQPWNISNVSTQVQVWANA